MAEAIRHLEEAVKVGSACAAGPVLVATCQRVVGADGSLKGYAGGLHLKESLLAFEENQKALFA